MRSTPEVRARRQLCWFAWLLALSLSVHVVADWASLSLRPAQPAAMVCALGMSSIGDCASTADGHVAYLHHAEPATPAPAFLAVQIIPDLRLSSFVLPPLTPPPPTA
jgi:hypothetical protein